MARRLETWAGLILMLAISLLAVFGGSPPEVELADSVENRAPDGRRALMSLARELGWSTRSWMEPPGRLRDLGDEGALLWLAQAPETLGLEEDGEGVSLLGQLHDPIEYLRFVARGGTLILPWAGSESFLVEHLGIEAFTYLTTVEEGDAEAEELDEQETAPLEDRTQPLRVHFDGRSEEFDLRLAHVDSFGELDPDGVLRPWLLARSGEVLGVEAPVEEGRLVVLADDPFTRNEALSESGNDAAWFCIKLVEELDVGGPLLFDEYALGRWQPTSKVDLAWGPQFGLLSAHLVLLVLLFVWRHAYRREFARDPDRAENPSPLARVRAQARLLIRAGKRVRLAESLRQGVLADWSRQLRIPTESPSSPSLAHSPDDSVEVTSSEEDGSLPSGADVRALHARWLDRILAHLDLEDEAPLWRGRLLGTTSMTGRDLVRLEAELERFDRNVLQPWLQLSQSPSSTSTHPR